MFFSQNMIKLERKLGTKSSRMGRPKWPCATFTWLSFFLCFFGLFIFLISNFSFHHLILILYQTKEFSIFLLFHLQLNIKTKISFIFKKKKWFTFVPSQRIAPEVTRTKSNAMFGSLNGGESRGEWLSSILFRCF